MKDVGLHMLGSSTLHGTLCVCGAAMDSDGNCLREKRSKRGRGSKSRAKGYEREVAKRMGGTRHVADTGGPEDVEHELYAIQVKSGLNVCNQILRDGMASAKAAAVGKNKLPCVVLVDRKPTRLGYYIVFELDPFADWHGLVKGELE